MGGKSSTVTSTTKPPAQVMQEYEALLAQANPIAQTPYQPYTGGFEQNQTTGFNTIANLNGASNGYFDQANTDLTNAAVPTSQTVNQYMSPYLNDVVNSTMANMNEQNAEQQQGVLGNAIAQGALGGNRVGVAQGELARQQNLANQSTIANLYNTGYNSALGAAQAQQQTDIGAASGLSNLGSTSMQTQLQQAAAQVGAGTQQQQWNYQQYQNALSYPFETTSWLANIAEGLGSGMGGTTSTTSPAGNTGSSVLGGLLGLGSLFLKDGGSVHRPQYAQGGIIPYSNPSGIMSANDNGMAGANDNQGYVPQVATAGAHLNAPQAAPSQGASQSGQMLNQGIGSMESVLKQKYPNGILAGTGNPSLPQTAPIPTPSPMDSPSAAASVAPVVPQPAQSTGLLSSLSNLFGLKNGGVARGYDSGGYVDDDFDPLNDPVVTPLEQGTQAYVPPLPAPINIQDRPVVAPADYASTPDQGPIPQARPSQGVAPVVARGVVPDMTPNNADMGTEASVMATDGRYYPQANGPQENIVSALRGNGIAPQTPSNARGGLLTAFSQINNAAGLPQDYLARTAQIESHFDPNANNGIAQGMFQFTTPTARQYGLTNPYDPIASANAAAKLADDNSKFLSAGLGRAPSGGELYLAHQQGSSGALNLLTHPNDLATDIVGRKAVVQNGGSPNMTAGQFANMWISQYNGEGSPSPAAGALNNLASGQPVQVAENSAPAGVAGQSGATATDAAPTQSYPTTTVPSQAGVVPSVRGDQTPHEGVLSSLLHGHGLNLTDDQRFALLQAGLGMMSGTSPNFLTNIGTGGLKGMEAYQQRQQLNRENALAQSEINLGSENTAIAGGRLALEAKRTAAQIAQETAAANLTNTQAIKERFGYPSNLPMAVTDVLDPTHPQLIQYPAAGGSQSGDSAASAPGNKGVAAPALDAESKVQQTASNSSQGPSSDAIVTDPTAAIQKMPVVNPMMATDVGREVIAAQSTKQLEEARAGNDAAQNMMLQLGQMKDAMANLPPSGLLTQGAGLAARGSAVKHLNSILSIMGEPQIDPNSVGSIEELNKISTRLGFELSRTLGSREAASIVGEAQAAVPSGDNTPQGAQKIISGLEAAAQRQVDYYSWLSKWGMMKRGDLTGADTAFNEANPVGKYLRNFGVIGNSGISSQAASNPAPDGTIVSGPNGKQMIKQNGKWQPYGG